METINITQSKQIKRVKMLHTLAEYEEAIKGSGLTVVDFTASWCGPCINIAPKFEAMANEMTNATFVKVDVDQNQDASEKACINCMPTFQLYKNGQMIDSMEGANESKLRAMVEKHLA